ncbi:MAG: M48 family metallopeptidase [Bacteroidales bacterium]|nr:M48 family metallopeptidase [Bacteroidales bacterium]
MGNTIEINGLQIEIERKPIKHMHLSVYPPDGRVHLSAPMASSEMQIRLFILSKWVWLIEKRESSMSHNIQPPREYVSGEAHYYKGDLYRLRVIVDPNAFPRAYIEGDYLVVAGNRKNQIETVLKKWYRERLQELLPNLVERWCWRLNLPIPQWEVKSMPQRWGSCNQAKSHIIFNVELAKKPVCCIEYIVAHEVMHLKERIHSDRFYRLLDTYMPGWEKLKEELNEFPIVV